MRKEYLILAVFVLFVWAVRDKVPPQLQFWKTFTTMITVQNNSDHKYASEPVERLVGTLDEDTDYRMNIQVNFAGVVTAQIGPASTAGSDAKSR